MIRTGQGWGLGVAAVLSVLLFSIPEVFLRLFSADPEVVRLGVPYMRVMTLCLVANALEIVTAEAVIASGHTRTMSIIFNLFSVARIPLAFVIPQWTGTGVVGIAWVITGTCLVRGTLIVLWARRGTWKRGLTHELRGAPAMGRAPETAPGPAARGAGD